MVIAVVVLCMHIGVDLEKNKFACLIVLVALHGQCMTLYIDLYIKNTKIMKL